MKVLTNLENFIRHRKFEWLSIVGGPLDRELHIWYSPTSWKYNLVPFLNCEIAVFRYPGIASRSENSINFLSRNAQPIPQTAEKGPYVSLKCRCVNSFSCLYIVPQAFAIKYWMPIRQPQHLRACTKCILDFVKLFCHTWEIVKYMYKVHNYYFSFMSIHIRFHSNDCENRCTMAPEACFSVINKWLHPTQYCQMQLLISAWDTCFWHQNLHISIYIFVNRIKWIHSKMPWRWCDNIWSTKALPENR